MSEEKLWKVLDECGVKGKLLRTEWKVQATQMNVLRRIQGVSRLDRVRNVDAREKLQQEGVLDTVKSRQEKWKIRMEEMSLERTTKKIFVGEMEGKRPRGRPRLKWTDNFK